MRNVFIGSLIAIFVLFAASAAFTQGAGGRQSATANLPYDPRDLSGVWGGQSPANLTKDEPPMTAAGTAFYHAQKTEYSNPPVDGEGNTDPILACEPGSVPRDYFLVHPIEIVQSPKETLMLLESYRNFRIIYTDGRKMADHPEGTWYGDSVGHWEGNTLVVTTGNFNGRSWFDKVGHPMSDQSVLTERLTRTDHDTLKMDITLHDPVNYTMDWGGTMIWHLRPADWEIEDYLCSPHDEQIMHQLVRDPASVGEKK